MGSLLEDIVTSSEWISRALPELGTTTRATREARLAATR